MHPVVTVLRLGGVDRPIGSYGIALSLAMLVGVSLAVRAAHRAKIDAAATLAVCGFVVAGSLAGAASLFALVEVATTGTIAGLFTRGFGLVFLGAPIGGGIALVLATRALKVPLGRLIDVAIHAIPAAHAIGRIGCFMGGCCFGAAYDGPLSVLYTDPIAPAAHPSIHRHPWPLYESAAMLVLASMFVLVPPKRAGDGRRGFAYFAAYGAIRIALEPLRGDTIRGVFAGGVSTSQILGALMLIAGLVGLAVLMRRQSAAIVAACCVLICARPLAAQPLRLTITPSPIVWLSAGTFLRGADADDLELAARMCRIDTADTLLGSHCTPELFELEWPAGRVFLSPYGLDRTEVTFAAYRRCVIEGRCAPPRVSEADDSLTSGDRPVVGVTWLDARNYCAFAGGRLPTEAEWERAARGPDGRPFPWGRFYNDRLANHGRLTQVGFDLDDVDGYRASAPVGSYIDGASPHGLLDMAGNVFEWTADAFVAEAYVSEDAVNPVIERGNGLRSARGGSFRSPPFQLRTTARIGVPEGDAMPDLGFRCAYDPPRRDPPRARRATSRP